MNSKSDRLGPIPAEASGAADTPKLALDCMLAALEHLDSDASISPFVGVQLQLAIDRLVSSNPTATPMG
jgi:hypothetical protein